MVRKLPMTVLVLVMLAGCTPTAENTARKSEAYPERSGQLNDVSVRLQGGADMRPLVDASTREIIAAYGTTVRQYADRYGFDWRLILAVMKQESRFAADAESEKGAAGLMQVMPVTGEEVAKTLEIDDPTHPGNNIRIGIFYLKKLHGLFQGAPEPDRTKLTLAAYNAGIGRIYDAQEIAAYFRDNPNHWQSIKDALPLLSKRFTTLHMNVWSQERPRNGWFGGSRQTVAYVESIMDYYEEYRLALN